MASSVTITEVKAHLRITSNVEDALLQLYMDAANDRIENYINRPIPDNTDSPPTAPAAIKAAALLIISDMYENREGAGEKEIKENPALKSLLYPYRVELGI